MAIECIDYREHISGALQGFATIWVPKMGLEIQGISLFSKEGRRWVSMPSKEYTNKEGEKKYSPIVSFRDKKHHSLFGEACLEAIDKWKEARPTQPSGYAEDVPPTEDNEGAPPF